MIVECKISIKNHTQIATDDAGFILTSDEIAKRGSWSFVNCWGVPNTMKSVFDGLRAKKLADIQDDIDWNAACNSVIVPTAWKI